MDARGLGRAGARASWSGWRTRRSTGAPEHAVSAPRGSSPSELGGGPPADLGLAARRAAPRSAYPAASRPAVKSHSIASSSVNPASDEHRERALQRGQDRPRLVARRASWAAPGWRGAPARGTPRGREDARVAAADADDAALLHDAAHLRGVGAEPVGDVRDGEPLVDQAVEGRLQNRSPDKSTHPGITPAAIPPRAFPVCGIRIRSHSVTPVTQAPSVHFRTMR